MFVSGGVTGVILYRLAGDKTGGCVALLAGGEAGSQMAGGKRCRVVVVRVVGGAVVAAVLLVGEAVVGVDRGAVVAVLLVGEAVVGVDGGAVVAVLLVGEAVVGVAGGAVVCVVVPAEREGGKIWEIIHSEVREGVRRIQARVRAQLSYSPAH
jgi:hypothetical protein